MQNPITSPGKRFVLPLIIFLLVITNSCQKWTPALDTGKINLTDNQKVKPDEVTSWVSNNLSPENQAQVQLGNAKQNVINYQHVVRIPIGVNAALFFTKDNGKLQAYAYKWLDKKPGEKLFTGYITEYSFQTGTAAEFSYQDSKITKRSGLMAGAPQGLSPAKNRMKITGGTTRPADISSIFSRFWCWLTGGTYVTEDDIASGRSYGANGESGATGCDYSSIQQNPEGGGDPSGNYQLNIDDSFAPTPPSVDFTVPPPDPSTGWVSVYTPPDAGCGFDANGNQVLTNDGSCQGQWTTFQLFPPITNSDIANAVFVNDTKSGINPTKYINCFNDGKTASGYKLTIYVAQPKPGANDEWTTSLSPGPFPGEFFVTPGGQVLNVGHTFVGFEKDNTDGTSVTQVMGFYPGPGALAGLQSKGVIKDDSNHPYNVSYTVNVIASQFNAALAGVVNDYSNSNYVLTMLQFTQERNCTDAAINWMADAGVPLPIVSRGPFANSPGDFGQALRNVTGANTASGTAPQGHGPCN